MARKRIVAILERHGVQPVFNRHEDSYQRTELMLCGHTPAEWGIVSITTGGGSDLYPVFVKPPAPLEHSHIFASSSVMILLKGYRSHW